MQYQLTRHNNPSSSNFPYVTGHSCQSSTFQEHERKNNTTFNQSSSQQFQYYSFNNANQGYQPKSSQRRLYQNESFESQEQKCQKLISTYRSRGEKSQVLLEKYDSLCKELKTIQSGQLVYLFIEEIEENQRTRAIISDQHKKLMWHEDELKLVQEALTEKRKAIQKLCETQSQNLDLIQTMEAKLRNRSFQLNDHYYQKYSQLQKYMNDYICSTNEAQEQMLKKIHLITGENERLMEDNQNLARDVFELQKLKDILGMKITNKDNALLKMHRKEEEDQEVIASLREENAMMKKDIEVLIQNLRSYEQFEIDLNKDNRQISSSLEFLRERLNGNCSLRADQKNNFVSFKNQEVEEYKNQLQSVTNQKEQILSQYQVLEKSCETMRVRLERVEQENERLIALQEQNNKNTLKTNNDPEGLQKKEGVETFKLMRRGQSKPELKQDSLDQSSVKAKSGFITNCASSSKAAVSRQTCLTRFDSKQNSQTNF